MFIRPDWRDPESYKFLLGDLHNPANVTVAWEFLRRNSEYQADSKKFLSEVYDWCFKNPKHLQETWGYLDSPSRLAVMFSCFSETCSSRDEYWRSHFDEKWGMESTVLPTDDDAWDFFLCQDFYPELFKPVLFDKVEGPRVLIPVDLSVPLEALLKMVEWRVRELRDLGIKQGTVEPRTTRVQSNRTYIEQLCILDAFAVGATVQEIGDVISPRATNDPESKQRDKRIKAAYQAALKMQNGGYRALIPDL